MHGCCTSKSTRTKVQVRGTQSWWFPENKHWPLLRQIRIFPTISFNYPKNGICLRLGLFSGWQVTYVKPTHNISKVYYLYNAFHVQISILTCEQLQSLHLKVVLFARQSTQVPDRYLFVFFLNLLLFVYFKTSTVCKA